MRGAHLGCPQARQSHHPGVCRAPRPAARRLGEKAGHEQETADRDPADAKSRKELEQAARPFRGQSITVGDLEQNTNYAGRSTPIAGDDGLCDKGGGIDRAAKKPCLNPLDIVPQVHAALRQGLRHGRIFLRVVGFGASAQEPTRLAVLREHSLPTLSASCARPARPEKTGPTSVVTRRDHSACRIASSASLWCGKNLSRSSSAIRCATALFAGKFHHCVSSGNCGACASIASSSSVSSPI